MLKDEDACLERTENGFVVKRNAREPLTYVGDIKDIKILRVARTNSHSGFAMTTFCLSSLSLLVPASSADLDIGVGNPETTTVSGCLLF